MTKSKKNILIINGPNLNMLGKREPQFYGNETLDQIKNSLINKSKETGINIIFEQSNSEGEIVNIIQKAHNEISALIINAGAYTHTSVAILDALKLLDVPIIEVHLSNIFAREKFRQKSLISSVALGIISGFGKNSYELAFDFLANSLKDN